MNDSCEGVIGTPRALAHRRRRVMTLLGLVAIGDWLLYDQKPGITVVLFIALLCIGVLVSAPIKTDRRLARATGILVVALGPLVEDFSFVALVFGAMGAACFALVVTVPRPTTLARQLPDAARLLLAGPLQSVQDLGRLRKTGTSARLWSVSVDSATRWVIPLSLSAVFVVLFASANPLIEGWVSRLSPIEIIREIDLGRIVFWTAVGLGISPFLFQTARFGNTRRILESHPPQDVEIRDAGGFFGSAAILRSLALFNFLFFIETILDLTYLWSGVTLPDGMSYASYAHRGAYPLILTALLAGGFVITAMKPGSGGESSPVIRGLVYVWILQNILLVVSAMARLKSYVDSYSLTYWRVATFIWMVLVAVGLALLILRIARHLSNVWLIRGNGLALAVALYACCFVNFPYVVAAYNLGHCREITGQGEPLDLAYLATLGPGAIPAMDDYGWRVPERFRASEIRFLREQFRLSFLVEEPDWHRWSFRRWRLTQYLDGTSTN